MKFFEKFFDKFFEKNQKYVLRVLRKRIAKHRCIKIVGIFVGKFEIKDRIEIKYI